MVSVPWLVSAVPFPRKAPAAAHWSGDVVDDTTQGFRDPVRLQVRTEAESASLDRGRALPRRERMGGSQVEHMRAGAGQPPGAPRLDPPVRQHRRSALDAEGLEPCRAGAVRDLRRCAVEPEATAGETPAAAAVRYAHRQRGVVEAGGGKPTGPARPG